MRHPGGRVGGDDHRVPEIDRGDHEPDQRDIQRHAGRDDGADAEVAQRDVDVGAGERAHARHTRQHEIATCFTRSLQGRRIDMGPIGDDARHGSAAAFKGFDQLDKIQTRVGQIDNDASRPLLRYQVPQNIHRTRRLHCQAKRLRGACNPAGKDHVIAQDVAGRSRRLSRICHVALLCRLISLPDRVPPSECGYSLPAAR